MNHVILTSTILYAIILSSLLLSRLHKASRILCSAAAFAAGLLILPLCFETLPSTMQATSLFLSITAIVSGVILSSVLERYCTVMFPAAILILVFTNRESFFFHTFPVLHLGILQSVACGILLHIVCSQILPDTEDRTLSKLAVLFTLIGLLIGLIKIF